MVGLGQWEHTLERPLAELWKAELQRPHGEGKEGGKHGGGGGRDRREKDERREIKGKWSYSRSILQEEEVTDTQKTQKKPVSKPEL